MLVFCAAQILISSACLNGNAIQQLHEPIKCSHAFAGVLPLRLSNRYIQRHPMFIQRHHKQIKPKKYRIKDVFGLVPS